MKIHLTDWLAAACVSISLFSNNTINTAGPFYFKVNAGVNIPTGTAGERLVDGQVTRVASVAAANCVGTGYDCVVTFATNLLTVGEQHLAGEIHAQIRNTIATRAAN
jgi:hypothetical protein